MAGPWNHNIHYHDFILKSVPPHCRRALDVGCGEGLLARQLAQRCRQVVAIDTDPGTIRHAAAVQPIDRRIEFLKADFMTYPFPEENFDMITAVATLHHLPLTPALERFRYLLKPGGVLAVIGLYRSQTLADYVAAAIALPASRIFRLRFGFNEVAAPTRAPEEGLNEIRRAIRSQLPGADLRRRLLFRYSVVWRKPAPEV